VLTPFPSAPPTRREEEEHWWDRAKGVRHQTGKREGEKGACQRDQSIVPRKRRWPRKGTEETLTIRGKGQLYVFLV